MVMVNLGSTDDSRYTGYREITDRDVLDLQCSQFIHCSDASVNDKGVNRMKEKSTRM